MAINLTTIIGQQPRKSNSLHFYETNLRPITETIRVEMKKSRQNCAGSLKKIIPTMTVPTAPMPVQTAYAVPIGKVWVALYKSIMLMHKQMKKPINQ